MKTPPSMLARLPVLVAFALVTLRPPANADEPKPAADPSAPLLAAPVRVQPSLINIDFSGGSVEQLVNAIAKTNSAAFNIVGEKNELAVQLPAFSVRNVEPGGLANALNGLLRQHNLNLLSSGSVEHMVFSLVRDERLRSFDPGRPVFESFQLAPYLADQSVDDIVGTIRAGWELDPAHDRAALRLKFHPATSVLLVSGPPDAIMLTKNILGQVRQAVDKKHPRNQPNPPDQPNPSNAENK